MAGGNGRMNGEGAQDEGSRPPGVLAVADSSVHLRAQNGLGSGQGGEPEPRPPIGGLRYAGRYLRGQISRALGFFLLVAIIAVAGSALVIRGSIFTVDWYPRWEDILLRLAAVFSLSFLPAWLFLRFMKTRAASVWTEYVFNLHRLCVDEPGFLPEPPATSIYHERWRTSRERHRNGARRAGSSETSGPTIYEQKFEAYYGRGTASPNPGRASHFRIETFFPVLLCTWIFALGWVMVLGRESTFDVATKLTAGDVLAFAFMGGYVFALQMLVRRYFQADLRPSAYLNAVVRVLTAMVVAGVVWRGQVAGLVRPGDWTEAQQLALSFGIGFFPIAGLQALQGLFSAAMRRVVPTLASCYPLGDIDGLNLWYESRLLEEGIEDMQNLATANLVDVILHTRVPVGRLVDWVDQAYLYLHLAPPAKRRRDGWVGSERANFRRVGIRTATDLEDAMGRRADHETEDVPPSLEDPVTRSLNDAWKADGVSIVSTVLRTLAREPNMRHVRKWREDWDDRDGSRPEENHQMATVGPSAESIAPASDAGSVTDGGQLEAPDAGDTGPSAAPAQVKGGAASEVN
jgi:hypothetical protein